MNNTRSAEVKKLQLNIRIDDTLSNILQYLNKNGHQTLIVGGSVRDAIMGFEPKDIDIEVYNINYEDLSNILSQYGKVDMVGNSFGVVKLKDAEGNDYDFSIPRKDNKTGIGHKDFNSTMDPSLTPEQACARRDFTINSLAYDPINHLLYDFYGGLNDIKNKTLRATSEAFSEDPLRVLRGMQFAARFDMELDQDTAIECKKILDTFNTLPKERLSEEFMKLMTKGKHPSKMIKYLIDSGWIDHFPEIKDIIGKPQDAKWHPEGTVDIHTGLVMDAAVKIADREHLTGDKRAVLLFAALGHDFAKAHTTQLTPDKNGEMHYTSYGHEEQSVPLAEEFLKRIGIKKSIIDKVKPIIEKHLAHMPMTTVKDKSAFIRKLSLFLHPASIQELCWLMEADLSGRHPLPQTPPPGGVTMLNLAKEEGIHEHKHQPKDLLTGSDIMPYFGNKGSIEIGSIITECYQLYLNNKLSTRPEALEWLHKRMSKPLLSGEDVKPYVTSHSDIHGIIKECRKMQLEKTISTKTEALLWLKQRDK